MPRIPVVADSHFKVYDTKTGKMIPATPLPFPGVVSPATYMVNGRQYVAFATSRGRDRKGVRSRIGAGSLFVAAVGRCRFTDAFLCQGARSRLA